MKSFLKKTLILIIAGTIIAAIGFALTDLPEDPNQYFNQSSAELQEDIEKKHPLAYYILAKKRFEEGKKDEAAIWFYIGQFRARYHIQTSPDLEPSEEPALFASLNHTIGTPINEYIAADIEKWIATIDATLKWEYEHDNLFTPKSKHPEAYEKIRSGLVDLKIYILENTDEIRKTREKNGLENKAAL